MDSGQIAARIRERRLKDGLTQQELADLAGVNLMMINRYERGHILPSVENLLSIAAALDVSVDYLVAATDDPRGVVNESDLSDDERRIVALVRRRDLPALLREVTNIAEDAEEQRIGGGNQPALDESTSGEGK